MELENAKLRGRIGDSRVGIVAKVEKLKNLPGLHAAELEAIDNAFNALKFLEREEDRYDENARRLVLETPHRNFNPLSQRSRRWTTPAEQVADDGSVA